MPSTYFNVEYKENFINLFGLNLNSDDVIIIFLLIFLFIENVQDIFLFIALILLLLT